MTCRGQTWWYGFFLAPTMFHFCEDICKFSKSFFFPFNAFPLSSTSFLSLIFLYGAACFNNCLPMCTPHTGWTLRWCLFLLWVLKQPFSNSTLDQWLLYNKIKQSGLWLFVPQVSYKHLPVTEFPDGHAPLYPTVVSSKLSSANICIGSLHTPTCKRKRRSTNPACSLCKCVFFFPPLDLCWEWIGCKHVDSVTHMCHGSVGVALLPSDLLKRLGSGWWTVVRVNFKRCVHRSTPDLSCI